MSAKKQVSKRASVNLAKKKPTTKKMVKKLSTASTRPKKKLSPTSVKKSTVVVKKRSGKQSAVAKKKVTTKSASGLRVSGKKITTRKQPNLPLQDAIKAQVEWALQHSILPLIQNLILERNKPEKTTNRDPLISIVGDDALVNLLTKSINQLQDSIDRFSAFIENRLIQAPPDPEKPAEVESDPAPTEAAAPPTPVSEPQTPDQAPPDPAKPAD